MNSRNGRILLALIGMLCSTGALSQACVAIASVPTTIAQPGAYCFTQNLRYEGASSSVSETAILIASDDVALDLRGFTLQGGAVASISYYSIAIRASERRNITIRNGNIRNFGWGLQLTDSAGGITPSGHTVEQLAIEGALSGGMHVNGQGSVVRDNRVFNMSSTSTSSNPIGMAIYGTAARVTNNAVTNMTSATSAAIGFQLNASASLVQDNSISNINPGRNAYGMLIGSLASGSLVKNNVIANSAATYSAITAATGSANVTVDGNVVFGYNYALALSSSASNKYKNNTVHGGTIPYSGGTNIGGNN